MLKLMQEYIPGFRGKPVSYQGYRAYQAEDRLFVILPARGEQDSYYELAALSAHMADAGFHRLAMPIMTTERQMLTVYENAHYMVVQMPPPAAAAAQQAHPTELALFHQIGASFPFSPARLSSYGQWEMLWSDRLAQAESLYYHTMTKKPLTAHERLFIDTFPYIIGVTENAIQYLKEADEEYRFSESDQATAAFVRYNGELSRPYVLPHQLIYDHPVRDVAEHIRTHLLHADSSSEITAFLTKYQQVRPISVFGMRLLYARLLMPLHLYDVLEYGIADEAAGERYTALLAQQKKYDEQMMDLYRTLQIDSRVLELPELDWFV